MVETKPLIFLDMFGTDVLVTAHGARSLKSCLQPVGHELAAINIFCFRAPSGVVCKAA